MKGFCFFLGTALMTIPCLVAFVVFTFYVYEIVVWKIPAPLW